MASYYPSSQRVSVLHVWIWYRKEDQTFLEWVFWMSIYGKYHEHGHKLVWDGHATRLRAIFARGESCLYWRGLEKVLGYLRLRNLFFHVIPLPSTASYSQVQTVTNIGQVYFHCFSLSLSWVWSGLIGRVDEADFSPPSELQLLRCTDVNRAGRRHESIRHTLTRDNNVNAFSGQGVFLDSSLGDT